MSQTPSSSLDEAAMELFASPDNEYNAVYNLFVPIVSQQEGGPFASTLKIVAPEMKNNFQKSEKSTNNKQKKLSLKKSKKEIKLETKRWTYEETIELLKRLAKEYYKLGRSTSDPTRVRFETDLVKEFGLSHVSQIKNKVDSLFTAYVKHKKTFKSGTNMPSTWPYYNVCAAVFELKAEVLTKYFEDGTKLPEQAKNGMRQLNNLTDMLQDELRDEPEMEATKDSGATPSKPLKKSKNNNGIAKASTSDFIVEELKKSGK